MVETLRLTSIVIGGCFVLIPISKLLTYGRDGGAQVSFFAMMGLLAVIILACRCLWRYWEITKHLTDTKPRHIYVSAASHSQVSAELTMNAETRTVKPS